jgi:hypothetical protein
MLFEKENNSKFVCLGSFPTKMVHRGRKWNVETYKKELVKA